MVKISFVVPIYNNAEYLPRCLESLTAQKEQALEIILIDDGSVDDSLSICRQYEQKDSRIRTIHQSNQGANVARNKGLLEAAGEWICFVDGDDWIEDDYCLALDGDLNGAYDVIIYSYYNVSSDKKKRSASNTERIEFKKNDFKELQLALMNRLGPYQYNKDCLNAVSCWNKIYRREFLLENHVRFVPEIQKLQDLTFNIQVYEYARTGVFVDKALYDYRFNPSSVTNRYQPDIVRKFDVIHEFLASFLEEHHLMPAFEAVYQERVATHSRTCIVLYFCNRNNKRSYAQRKQDFLELMKKEPYATAIAAADLNHFPVREKILSWAIRKKMFWVCELLTRLQHMWDARKR